jgi:plasmid maintenance system antidote protein VapI
MTNRTKAPANSIGVFTRRIDDIIAVERSISADTEFGL